MAVLRVALEGQGVVGYVEVNDRMSLFDARKLVAKDIPQVGGKDCAGWNFHLPDRTPVAKAQEKKQTAASFAPTIMLCRSANSKEGKQQLSQSNRVTVLYGQLSFQTWITENYRFADLRQDAARFWSIPCECVLLTDAGGCNWPDNGTLLQAIASGLLEENKIFLAPIEQRAVVGSSDQEALLQEHKEEEMDPLETSRFVDEQSLGPLSSPQKVLNSAAMDQRYLQLWNIFTYQCVQGSATRPFYLERKRWSTFLKSIGVTEAKVPVVQRDIIYSVNSTRRAGLDFDGFLNALVDTAVILFPSQARGGEGQEVNAFVEFLSTYVIPMAPSWDTKVWKEQEVMCSFEEVHRVFETFKSPLKAIFNFYSPAVESNKMDMEVDRHLAFSSFSSIVLDFQLVEIGVRSHQLAETFLASAQDSGIRLSNSPNMSSPPESFSLGAMSSPQSSFTFDLSSHRKSVTCERPRPNVWDYPELSYDQFIGALLRLALHGFGGYTSDTGNCSPREAPADRRLKALLQHFYGVLRMSHVKVILEKRKDLIRNPATFLYASVEFERLFTTMWQSEGRQDYALPERERSKPQTGREVLAALIERHDSDQVIVSTLGLKGRENNCAAMAALVETNTKADNEEQKCSVGQEAVVTSGRSEIPTLLRDPDAAAPTQAPQTESPKQDEGLLHQASGTSCSEQQEEVEGCSALKQTLTNGYTFIKHSKHSTPHPRQVWCDTNLERIYWAPSRKEGRELKCKSMPMADITKVERYDKGLTRKRFSKLIKLLHHRHKRKAKNSSAQAQPRAQSFGMHVVGKTRSLVLEGHDEGEINAFMQALNWAIGITA